MVLGVVRSYRVIVSIMAIGIIRIVEFYVLDKIEQCAIMAIIRYITIEWISHDGFHKLFIPICT